MDPLVSHGGSGNSEPPASQLKRVDHGVSPLKPDPKRRRSGCLQLREGSSDLQSTPGHEDRCCNCTKTSTCQTKRCECFAACRPCLSCDCKERCRNRTNKNQHNVINTPASGTDGSPTLAKVLNFDSAGGSQKS
jgi:hypothetical protein